MCACTTQAIIQTVCLSQVLGLVTLFIVVAWGVNNVIMAAMTMFHVRGWSMRISLTDIVLSARAVLYWCCFSSICLIKPNRRHCGFDMTRLLAA